MSKRAPAPASLTVRDDQPLIAIPDEENGQRITRYFNDEAAADAAMEKHDAIRRALELAGAWRDLDWDEMIDELDRIRHANSPTPPIEMKLTRCRRSTRDFSPRWRGEPSCNGVPITDQEHRPYHSPAPSTIIGQLP